VSKQKVLVLEDETIVRETICDYFQQHGHEAIGADSCVHADPHLELCSAGRRYS
jgi:hypothetical protein